MIKFIGEPFQLIRFNPPIGLIKYVRFDENGEYVTDNDRIIKRFHHRFDSVPAEGSEHTPELSDDDMQLDRTTPDEDAKQYPCKKCEIVAGNRSELMNHYRKIHPKEG